LETSVKSIRQAKTKLAPNGRIVIPAEIRRALGFEPGETLVMDVQDGALRIETFRQRIKRIQDEFAKLIPPGVSLVDELLADRREEVRREREELERQRKALLESSAQESLKRVG
jgi:AbrB family looped-hinge helix DNA binding protein